jgi:hypothetical protein
MNVNGFPAELVEWQRLTFGACALRYLVANRTRCEVASVPGGHGVGGVGAGVGCGVGAGVGMTAPTAMSNVSTNRIVFSLFAMREVGVH